MRDFEGNAGSPLSTKDRIRERCKGINPDELEVIPALPKENIFESTKTRRVAVYARVSTGDPRQTSSYELQKNHYLDVVNRNPSWSLVDIYADEGISGTSLAHRDEFKRNKRRPKQVTCPVFFHKIIEMMSWNPDYRYKILGKMIRSNGEYLFIFDLNNAEVYQRIFKEGEKTVSSRKPLFPAEWQNQFGLPYEEHKKSLQVNLFNGYTVFGLKNNTSKDIELEANAEEEEQPITLEDAPDNNIGGGGHYGL